MNFLQKNKRLLLYGLSLALLFFLLKMMEYRLLIIDHSVEIYAGSIALLFTLLGIWLSRKLMSPRKEITIVEKEKIIEKEVFVEKEKSFVFNQKASEEAALSERELEVLALIARGMSNQEIATTLFLSVNTIKTHINNLFFKLEVTRRTQAVDKAKQLSLIP